MKEPDDRDATFSNDATIRVENAKGNRRVDRVPGATAHLPPRYEAIAVLGVGGMGQVDLCRDSLIGRDVAIKSIHADAAQDATTRARFEREARVQARLEHPAIVPVYEIDHGPGGEAFFVMKRVNGMSLAHLIDDLHRGDLAGYVAARPRLLRAFSSACLAVAFAHSRGVIHRDLKPANVMLGEFGEVNVLDWGIAKVVGDHDTSDSLCHSTEPMTLAGVILGTPGYMAPEQADDIHVDARADVYALGCILFELLALEPLHGGDNAVAKLRSTLGGELTEADRTPSARAPERSIPPELDAVCVKSTSEDADERYASAREVAEAIEGYLDGARDTERRRELSRGHVEAAHRAAQGAASTVDAERAHASRILALREANLALALDPSNRRALSAIGDLLLTAPDRLPVEGELALAREVHRKFRSGMKEAAWAFTVWFLWVPVLVQMGVRSWGLAIIGFALIGLCFGSAYWLSRRKRVTWRSPLLALICGTCLLAMVYNLFGAFIMLPCILVTSAGVWLINTGSYPKFQTLSFVSAVSFYALVCGLETAGILSPSTVITGNAIIVVPRLVNFPPILTRVVLWSTTLSMYVVPAILAIRVTRALADAERRLFAQAWLARKLSE